MCTLPNSAEGRRRNGLVSDKARVCSHDTGSLVISLVASDNLSVLQNSHTGSSNFHLIVNIGFDSLLKNVLK